MNRINLLSIALGVFVLISCNKQFSEKQKELNSGTPAENKTTKVAACWSATWSLSVDPATGYSYVYKIGGTPGSGPLQVGPAFPNHQLTTCSGTPIRFATGLAYDPATGIFFGTTGANGSPANSILKFRDANCVSVTPAIDLCGINLDLSDIERDPTTNEYYAINRSTTSNDNRLVKIDITTGPYVSCLPSAFQAGATFRGLAIDCSGQIYVMHPSRANAKLIPVDKTTGVDFGAYGWPGDIAPSATVATPEIGLHFDCACTQRFLTANYDPFGLPTLMTDALPQGMPGGPVYYSANGVLEPTVDFAAMN